MRKFFKIISLFIIVCVLFAGCKSVESKYDEAVNYMNNEKWELAIESLENINYEDSEELLKECKMHIHSDYDFLDAMSVSLMKRYDKAEKTDDLEKCIEIEIASLNEFKNADFYDENLKKLALAYIEGVETEKESLTQEDGEKQIKKQEGYVKRLNALKSLTDEYGLLKDNVDYIATYYNNVEKENEKFIAFKEIENDLEKQFVDKEITSDYVNDYTQRLVLKNNTQYDYDLIMYFTFYDKKGTIVDTTSEYYDNVEAGKKVNLDFYFPENASTFKFYTEEYIRE